MNIGAKIKKARIAKGMTQEELGELLGVQKSAVAKYESGRVVNIKRSTMKKISDILDIPPFELVFDEEKQKMYEMNDFIAEVVIRMQSDEDFRRAVEVLYKMDSGKVSGVRHMLEAFGE